MNDEHVVANSSAAVTNSVDLFVNQTTGDVRSSGYRGALFDVTLHEGDTLYLPPFWFHAVVAVDDSLSISRSLRSYEASIFC